MCPPEQIKKGLSLRGLPPSTNRPYCSFANKLNIKNKLTNTMHINLAQLFLLPLFAKNRRPRPTGQSQITSRKLDSNSITQKEIFQCLHYKLLSQPRPHNALSPAPQYTHSGSDRNFLQINPLTPNDL
jgi:hypothetical protein